MTRFLENLLRALTLWSLLCCSLLGPVRGIPVEDPRLLQQVSSNETAATTTSSPQPPLLCQVRLYDMLYLQHGANATASQDFYICQPVVEDKVLDLEYRLEDLPETVETAHALALANGTDLYISLPNTSLPTDESISWIQASTATIVSSPPIMLRRRLAPSTGTNKLLIVHITTRDAAPTTSGDRLYELVFVDAAGLKWQYHACSAGQLTLNPALSRTVQVSVHQRASSGNTAAVVNAAHNAAAAQLGVQSLYELADHVFYVTPPMGNWLAYATIGAGRSVYNDEWATYLAVQLHEVGHNFGLTHANEGNEYDDFTGAMGGAVMGFHTRQGFPRLCFNAFHHHHLGWFASRTRDLTGTPESVLLKVAAFVDYSKTSATEHVLVSDHNHFMQYNRAKAHNTDTVEYPDTLVIVQNRGNAGTELLAALDPSLETVFSARVAGETWMVHVCAEVQDQTGMGPDYLWVSVGYTGSVCHLVDEEQPGGTTVQDTPTAPACEDTLLADGVSCFRSVDCCSGFCRPNPADPFTSICSTTRATGSYSRNRDDDKGGDKLSGSRTRGAGRRTRQKRRRRLRGA